MIGDQFVSLASVDVPTSCTHWVEGKNSSLSAEKGLGKDKDRALTCLLPRCVVLSKSLHFSGPNALISKLKKVKLPSGVVLRVK